MQRIISVLLIISLSVIFTACGNKKQSAEKDVEQTGKSDSAATGVSKKTILFFGNSITAGYGLEPTQAFPAIIQQKIDSLGLPYQVINAGVSGETTAGGNGRIDWILQQHVDIFILELGGNDGLRGIAVAETRKNLQSIIDKVHAKNPDTKIVLTGMQIPPSMGQDYIGEFKGVYPELATKNNLYFVPFLLDGVGGEPELNQQDGIHPNIEGNKIVAENVWKVLRDIL